VHVFAAEGAKIAALEIWSAAPASSRRVSRW